MADCKQQLEYLIKHLDAVREHWDSIVDIKFYLHTYEDVSFLATSMHLGYAAEAWFELPENVQEVLWRAPSKGSVWTTQERDMIKSKEFREAYYGK